MSDLISRQTALNTFEKWLSVKGYSEGEMNMLKGVIYELRYMPSAQPEIIRCRDCKYAHLTYHGQCKYCDKWLDDDDFHLTLYLDGDFYCGCAERRTDETN